MKKILQYVKLCHLELWSTVTFGGRGCSVERTLDLSGEVCKRPVARRTSSAAPPAFFRVRRGVGVFMQLACVFMQLALVEVLGCDGHPGHSRGSFHVVRAEGDVCVAFLRNHSTLLLSYSAVAQNNVRPQKMPSRTPFNSPGLVYRIGMVYRIRIVYSVFVHTRLSSVHGRRRRRRRATRRRRLAEEAITHECGGGR
jgi:hypothetical protein